MLTRSRALGIGLSSLLLGALASNGLPGCGGDSSGLGDGDGGTDTTDDSPSSTCRYAASFVTPADGAKLGVADDISGKKCAGGLVTNVAVATSAPDGTAAKLFADDAQVATAIASGAKITFANVTLASKAAVKLRVQIGDDTSCAVDNINIDCGVPACAIASPKGPYLNGRLVADGGDRVNAVTDPFATTVSITTDAGDGQSVTLSVDGKTPLKAVAMGGKASFATVSMAPDGVHTLSAICTSATGSEGGSGVSEYTVVTGPVNLDVSSPAAGSSFGVADDVDTATAGVQFKVCGTTTTAAAIDLPADARGGTKNFCSSAGSATPVCVAMTASAGGTGSVCENFTCPDGAAPFDLNVILSDKAGNQAKVTRTGIRCDSKLPSVQIVAPIAYDSSKPATILNFASGETGTAAGALKKTVVACTDKSPSKAQLNVGLAGGTILALGAPIDVVGATAADGCPVGLGFVARFSGVTMPDSRESTDGRGTLVAATELRVDVTDSAGDKGSSPAVDEWVDTIGPSLSLSSPACGKTYPGAVDVTDSVKITSDTLPVSFKVTGSTKSGNYPVAAFDGTPTVLPAVATISSVAFYVGGNDLTLTATDAAGNTTNALTTCKVFVGTPPIVLITSPTDGAKFGEDSNVDAATHKYRTNITGTITGATSATTVSLRFGSDAPVATAPITSGAFTFSSVLLPESDALMVTVELSDSVYGTIGRSETLVVDTHSPTMSGALTAAVNAAQRRAGAFDLGWTAGSDFDPITSGARACDHYEVRRATTVINSETTWSAATVASSSVGGGLTSTTTAVGRIPASEFFAIRCVDRAGNSSAIVNTSAAQTADFIQNVLAAPTGATGFGIDASASLDLTKDATPIPDLVVGSVSGKAYVYFGHRPTSATDSGYNATPDLVLTGSGLLGASVTELNDFNADGRADLALGAPADGKVWIISGNSITASASDVAVATLGADALTIAGDGSTSLFGGIVRNGTGFDSAGKTDVLIRGKFGGNWGVVLLTGRAISATTLTMPAAADFYVRTAGTGAFGFSSGFQDVDGDGLTDLLTGDANAKTIYLFKGRSGSSATPLLPTDANASLTSSDSGDSFGMAIGLPGKITGLRFDAVVGAPTSPGFGRADVVNMSAVPLTTSTSISGAAGTQLGMSTLAVMPGQSFDVDKDAIADILVCTSVVADASTSNCHLFYGASSLPALSVADAAVTFPVNSTTYTPAVRSLGDIDGDTYSDFVICAAGGNSCRIVR